MDAIAGSNPVIPAMALLLIFLILINLPISPSLHQPKKITPLDEKSLLEALKEGHSAYFHNEVPNKRLFMAWAQVGLENGQGSKIYNYNFGNIGASKREPHFFISGYRFKANNSITDGTYLYWKTIKTMCASVLPYFDIGDPQGAAYQLYRCGYYHSDREIYARNMSQLYWKISKQP